MNINEIALKLLNLRENRMTGFLMVGLLREELGFEGYGEALRRRWIEADMEQSGMVTLTNNLGVIQELRKLASECKAKCGTCNKAKCDCSGRCDSCEGEKCTCEAKQESITESDTNHFFAVAHANRARQIRENDEAWAQFEPQMRQYFLSSPKLRQSAQASGMSIEDFYQSRMPEMKAHFDKMAGGQGGAPAEPVAAPYTPPPGDEAAPEVEFQDKDYDEFYGGHQDHLKKQFYSAQKTAHLDEPGRDAAWGEFEPQLKSHFRTNPKIRNSMNVWHRSGRWGNRGNVAEPQRGNIQAPGPDTGVNDSLIVSNLMAIMEIATLGLGRVNPNEAPSTPVPGLGAQSARQPVPTTAVNPPVASTGAPARNGELSTNIVQAEAIAKSKFGRPFAELSPDQQAQVENDLRRAAPPAR